ncbi:hypothetical protein ACFWIA_26840 [Streptomyces sp. NPDC127068]|uniref:hypothetical protein n=1 Tax=Streptomyces sp. NPDC127068 TaxID=3347127 RepID=UPI003666CB82
MPSRTKVSHRHLILFWLLVALLVAQICLLGFSAFYDIAAFAKQQLPSALLRLLIVALNIGALAHLVVFQWVRSGGDGAGPPGTAPVRKRRHLKVRPSHSVASRGSSPWGDPLVLLSQAAAVPMFFIPVWIELQSPHHHAEDWFWFSVSALLLLGAALVLVAALVRGHVKLGWVAVGALLPLLGFAQFAYLTFYKPTHERPKVDVTTELVKVDGAKGMTRLRGTVTLKNNGTAPAEVFGAVYTVSRHRMESAEGLTPEKAGDRLDAPEEPDHEHVGRFVALLGLDELLAAGESLAPGETRTRSFVLDAPSGGADLARLTADLSLSTPRGRAKAVECAKGTVKPPHRCWETALPPTSWIRRSMGDSPKIRTRLFLPTDTQQEQELTGPPYLSTTYHYDGGERRGEAQSVDPLIRVQLVQSVTEVHLGPAP